MRYPPRNRWSDEQVEQIVGNLLRVGVLLSATIVIFGGVVYLIRNGTDPPEYGVFRGEPSDLRSLGGIISDILSFRGRGIIQLGLLLLVFTPILRVAFAAFAFAQEQDYIYLAVAIVVLTVLVYGISGVII